MNHVRSLKMESNVKIPGDVGSYVGVREQRLTGFFSFVVIGLSVFLAPVLRHIPMAVLYGVFLYMGVQALDGIQIIDRLLLMLMPNKYQPDIPYLRHIRMLRIHLFTLIQVLLLAVLWVIKLLPFVAIIFPLMFVVMVIIRFLMRHCFTDMELVALDEDLPPPFGNKVSSGNRYRSPSGDTSSIGTKNGASTLLSSERRTNTGLNDELSLSMARSPSKIRFAEQEKFEDEVFDKVETPTSPSYGGLAPSRFSYHNKLPWMPEAKCSETDERGAGTP